MNYHHKTFIKSHKIEEQIEIAIQSLWCLMPLSTIFQLRHGSQFYWWRRLEYPEKKIAIQLGTLNHYQLIIDCQQKLQI